MFETRSFLLYKVLAYSLFINSAANKSVGGCLASLSLSLSELERTKEQDVWTLLERAMEFKTKADARVSELVLKPPQCLAVLTHSHLGTEEHLLLDLPTESKRAFTLS